MKKPPTKGDTIVVKLTSIDSTAEVLVLAVEGDWMMVRRPPRGTPFVVNAKDVLRTRRAK